MMQKLSLLCIVLSFMPITGMDNAMGNLGSLSAMEESRSKLLRSESRPPSRSEPSDSHLGVVQSAMEMPSSTAEKGPKSKKKGKKGKKFKRGKRGKKGKKGNKGQNGMTVNSRAVSGRDRNAPIQDTRVGKIVTEQAKKWINNARTFTDLENKAQECNQASLLQQPGRNDGGRDDGQAMTCQQMTDCQRSVDGNGNAQDEKCCAAVMLNCMTNQPDCVQTLISRVEGSGIGLITGQDAIARTDTRRSLLEGSAIVSNDSLKSAAFSLLERRAESKARDSSYEDAFDEAVTRKCR